MTAADTNSQCAAKPFAAATRVGDKKMDGMGVRNTRSFLEWTKVLQFAKEDEKSALLLNACVFICRCEC